MNRADAETVMQYAREHYGEDGWDMIVECYTVDLLLDEFGDLTYNEGFDTIQSVASTWHSRCLDARFE